MLLDALLWPHQQFLNKSSNASMTPGPHARQARRVHRSVTDCRNFRRGKKNIVPVGSAAVPATDENVSTVIRGVTKHRFACVRAKLKSGRRARAQRRASRRARTSVAALGRRAPRRTHVWCVVAVVGGARREQVAADGRRCVVTTSPRPT